MTRLFVLQRLFFVAALVAGAAGCDDPSPNFFFDASAASDGGKDGGASDGSKDGAASDGNTDSPSGDVKPAGADANATAVDVSPDISSGSPDSSNGSPDSSNGTTNVGEPDVAVPDAASALDVNPPDLPSPPDANGPEVPLADAAPAATPDAALPDSAPDSGRGGCPDQNHDGIADCQQTLVSNADFKQAITPWNPERGSSGAWDTNDGNGDPQSGSLAVTNADASDIDAQNGWTTVGSFQCIPVTTGSTYELAAQVYLPSGQGSGWVGFVLDYYAAPSCFGLPGALPFLSPQVTTTNVWQSVAGTTTRIPSGIVSVAVRLVASKPVAQPTLKALFDNVLVNER